MLKAQQQEIHENLLSIENVLENYDVFLFDAYGVFWNGKNFYKGSLELLEKLVNFYNKTVYILSNTTPTSKDTIESYAKKGLIKGKHYHELITSGEVVYTVIQKKELKFKTNPNPKKVYILGAKTKLFNESAYQVVSNPADADFFYIGVPQLTETEYNSSEYKKSLRESSKLLKENEPRMFDSLIIEPFLPGLKRMKELNLPCLNVNPDYTASEGVKNSPDESNFVIRQGSIAKAYKDLGGEVLEFGKPHLITYEFIFKILEKNGITLNKNRVLMIGDTLRTDIAGGVNAGIKTCLCTKTGVTANDIKAHGSLEQVPDYKLYHPTYLVKGISYQEE